MCAIDAGFHFPRSTSPAVMPIAVREPCTTTAVTSTRSIRRRVSSRSLPGGETSSLLVAFTIPNARGVRALRTFLGPPPGT